jgi:hypothetical protein
MGGDLLPSGLKGAPPSVRIASTLHIPVVWALFDGAFFQQ